MKTRKPIKPITLVWKDLETIPGHIPSVIGYAGANKVAQIVYDSPIKIIIYRNNRRQEVRFTCDLANLSKKIAQFAYDELRAGMTT